MTNGNLLVALEPSEEGRHVWDVASNTAARCSFTPSLINVIEPAVAVYADLNFTPLIECAKDWQESLRREHLSYLQHMAPDVKDAIEVCEGYPPYEIARRADDVNAALIVMGLHNRRGIQRLMGSTTHAVMNNSERDVLAIHPDSGDGNFSRVLIAADTSDLAGTVFEKAKAFIPDGATAHVVSVLVPLSTVFAAPEAGRGLDWSFTELTQDIQRETESKLHQLIADNGLSGAELTVRTGDPRDEIIAAANDMNADLIVIGSNYRGALNRLLLGSTARSVLDQTPCDTLVCRGEHH